MGNKKKEKDKKNDKDMARQLTLTNQLLALVPKGSSLDDLLLTAINELNLSDEHVVNIVKTLKDEAKQIAMDSRDKGKGKDSFQEVKSKGKKKEAKEKSKDEDSNVNADNVPADSREVVENEKEILNCSEQETCTMDADSFQEVKSKGKKKEAKEKSKEILNRSEQETCTMDADKAVNRLLSQAGILRSGPPSNSDVLDVATKRVPISSYRLISGQRTMADVVKMSLASSKESVAKGAVEDDCHLTERPDESAARRDQRRESTSISNQNFRDDNDSYNNKNGEAVQRETFEHNQTKDPPAFVDTNLQELAIENDELEPSVKELLEALQIASVSERQLNRQAINHPYSEPMLLSRNDGNMMNSRYGYEDFSQVSRRFPSFEHQAPLLIASVSEPQLNRQAINRPYSQPMLLSRNDGNMMNYPDSQPTQNDTYNMSPSAFQQHGGHNNSSNHLGSSIAPLSHYRNSDMSPSAVRFAYSSTNSSAYGPTNGSAYGPTDGSAYNSAYGSTNGSAYGFGMASDNAANSRYGYEDFSQNGNSNIWTWTPQGGLNHPGSNYLSLYSDHQNQQSQSVRHSQQQQQQEEQDDQFYRAIGYATERRGDPSNQTQQQQWPRNNN